MTSMYIAEDCVRYVPLAKRPNGYIYVCCDNLHESNQTYYGEFCARTEKSATALRYTVDHIDVTKRFYRLRLFSDRRFEAIVIEALVEFGRDDPHSILVSEVVRNRNEDSIPHETCNLIHLMIYERIICQIMHAMHLIRFHAAPDVYTRIGVAFPLQKRTIDDFFDSTFMTFEEIVCVLDATSD